MFLLFPIFIYFIWILICTFLRLFMYVLNVLLGDGVGGIVALGMWEGNLEKSVESDVYFFLSISVH